MTISLKTEAFYDSFFAVNLFLKMFFFFKVSWFSTFSSIYNIFTIQNFTVTPLKHNLGKICIVSMVTLFFCSHTKKKDLDSLQLFKCIERTPSASKSYVKRVWSLNQAVIGCVAADFNCRRWAVVEKVTTVLLTVIPSCLENKFK